MTGVTVRPMSLGEFEDWQNLLAQEYAEEQVGAGRWSAEGALERARSENRASLPEGLDTPRMLILSGLDDQSRLVGRAWVGLDHPRGTPGVAFLYDIQVNEGSRGRGLGRALLGEVERATRLSGVAALELNVFGSNRAAVGLYETSGYVVTTQQMRKAL